VKTGKPKKNHTTKYDKKGTVSAERFVSVVLANDLSDSPKHDYQIARELKICRQYFYDLLCKYAPELTKARDMVQQQIYRDAVRMLRKRLRKKFDLGVMAFAFGVSGVSFAQPASQASGITQNFYGMEIGTLEQLMAKHFQEARRKNSSKPGRKA